MASETDPKEPGGFFFRYDGESFHPEPIGRGPWGETLHGRLLGGLTAREVESFRTDDPELTCARLTIDLFRAASLTPLQLETRVVRRGGRIAVLDVVIEQSEVLVGQGRAVLLRRGEQPEGPFRSTPRWAAPAPVGDVHPPKRAGGSAPMWDSWGVGTTSSVQDGVWIRELHDLVAGEPLTPLIRSAMAADLVSPVTNSAPGGLPFINVDYTLYLGREPQGEHIGIQPYGQISGDGVSVGQCIAHDRNGPFGYVAAMAIANNLTRANRSRISSGVPAGDG